ncbi:MAG TPA: CBS domain-containing protein [Opitutaceae bacterium]|nr:CBS domain-containing protein [Opitutaceae bacterium]
MNTSIDILLEQKGSLVYSVQSTATVCEAVREMNKHKVGCVLIMDGSNLAGIFTERDVLTRVVSAELDPKATPVAQVMSKRVITVSSDASAEEVMIMFAERRCRHLPVMDNGQLRGLISIGDISRHLAGVYRMEAEQLKQYIAGGYPS